MIGRPVHRSRRVLICVGLLAAGAGLGAVAARQWKQSGRPNSFATVEPGVLYRSGQPYKRQIDHLIEEIGLRAIVIARKDFSRRLPKEIEYARSRGLRVLHLPLESRREISEEAVAAFYRWIDDSANRPMLVHCSAGRHRTGYLCARYRIDRQGWSREAAAEEMLSFDPDMRENGRPEFEQLKRYRPSVGGLRPATTSANEPPTVPASLP